MTSLINKHEDFVINSLFDWEHFVVTVSLSVTLILKNSKLFHHRVCTMPLRYLPPWFFYACPEVVLWPIGNHKCLWHKGLDNGYSIFQYFYTLSTWRDFVSNISIWNKIFQWQPYSLLYIPKTIVHLSLLTQWSPLDLCLTNHWTRSQLEHAGVNMNCFCTTCLPVWSHPQSYSCSI